MKIKCYWFRLLSEPSSAADGGSDSPHHCETVKLYKCRREDLFWFSPKRRGPFWLLAGPLNPKSVPGCSVSHTGTSVHNELYYLLAGQYSTVTPRNKNTGLFIDLEWLHWKTDREFAWTICKATDCNAWSEALDHQNYENRRKKKSWQSTGRRWLQTSLLQAWRFAMLQ